MSEYKEFKKAHDRKIQAPGRAERKGITIRDAIRMFDTEEKAQDWFESQRWPDGITCPSCGGSKIVRRKARKNNMPPLFCATYKKGVKCGTSFSVKTGTIMHKSPLPLHVWGEALYVLSTGLKGVSSMKLHRDLGITQKSAWHLLHRIREAWDDSRHSIKFSSEVEVDEAYFGGKESNRHEHKRTLKGARGAKGKTAVVGAKDRATNRITARKVDDTTSPTLHGFIRANTTQEATLYTDEARAYRGINRNHKKVKHSEGEYVRGATHVNGIESFWATLKRAHKGTFHHFSAKHLGRYAAEFAGRHNLRPYDTEEQMSKLLRLGVGKQLRYADLIGPPITRRPKLIVG